MKLFTCSLLIVLSFITSSYGQTGTANVMIGGGHSFTGTGDANGYAAFNQVDLPLGKNLFLSPGLQFTNHVRRELLTYYELRYITTGLNLFTNINYLVLNKPRHRIAVGAGPVLRLQSTSEPSEVSVTASPSGEPTLSLEYNDPLHTVSLGYNISPAYYFQFSKKWFLGAKLILQNDTRGDLLRSEMLFIGVNL